MFGHIAQMPQILRRAGINQAVVWRGVPESVESHQFAWRAPDGSEVTAEYLVGGYGNGAYLLEVPARAADNVRGYRELMRRWYGDESLLAMYGTDHMAPLPEMVGLLEQINHSQDQVSVRIETLAEYMSGATTGDGTRSRSTEVVVGELRSGARANMLMGVTSSHIDIKAAAAHAERWLTRYAEPINALHGIAWPAGLLDLAWGRVIDCSAHDSICGCSVDPVAAQVLVRLAEAEQIARELTARQMAVVAGDVPFGGWLWFNPSPTGRTSLIELDVQASDDALEVALELADGRLLATQEISRNRPLLFEAEMEEGDISLFLHRRPHGRELFGRRINGATIEAGTVTLWLDVEADPEWLDVEQLFGEIEEAVASAPGSRWTLRVISAPRRRVYAMAPGPALGFLSARPVPRTAKLTNPVSARPDRLDNGLISVSVAADGTLTIERDATTVTGVGRLVDGGDAGDSYNYGPPAKDVIVDQPIRVDTTIAADGPVVAELVVSRTYRWPVGLSEDRTSRSSTTIDTTLDMHVELRAGEDFLRLRLNFDNQANDHRVRFHVPLAQPADSSGAEGQYGVVERGLTAEGGHGEVPLPTYPAYGWVDAGGLAVLLDHVTEYELVEDGKELALTCLRSIGMISRNDNPYREDPAGPERPMPAAQMHGRRTIKFGLYPHAGSWDGAGVIAVAESYANEFVVARGGWRSGMEPGATLPGGLTVSGRGVVLTALHRRDDWLEIRIVAERPHATTATIAAGISAARNVDFLGRPGDKVEVLPDGSVLVPLDPWEIRTIQIQR